MIRLAVLAALGLVTFGLATWLFLRVNGIRLTT